MSFDLESLDLHCDELPLTSEPWLGLLALWDGAEMGLRIMEVATKKEIAWYDWYMLLVFLEQYNTEAAFNLIFRERIWLKIPELDELGNVFDHLVGRK